MKKIFCIRLHLSVFLIFVNHLFALNSDGDSTLSVNGGSLAKLYWAEEEVRSISEMLKGDHYDYKRATEAIFKEKAPDASILHLATHALINDENPMYSQLILTPDTNSSEDGFLNTYELYNMDLNADLVVLSACNTGYGKLVKGEGVMSLARGFTYAGCPSIVMSLWQVDDQSTSMLMQDFYKGINAGLRKDEALTLAKRKLLENDAGVKTNPFYWAGFVSIGSTDPIPVRFSLLQYIWFFLPLALIASLLIILNKRKTV